MGWGSRPLRVAPGTNRRAPLSAGSCLGSGACGVWGPAATDSRTWVLQSPAGSWEGPEKKDFTGNTQGASLAAGGEPNPGTQKAVTSLRRQDPWVARVLSWNRGPRQDARATAGFVFAGKVTGRVSAWMLCAREDAAGGGRAGETRARWLTWGFRGPRKGRQRDGTRAGGGCGPREPVDPPALSQTSQRDCVRL